jgi:hypothetical protein
MYDEPVKSLTGTLECHSRFRGNDIYLRMHQVLVRFFTIQLLNRLQ